MYHSVQASAETAPALNNATSSEFTATTTTSQMSDDRPVENNDMPVSMALLPYTAAPSVSSPYSAIRWYAAVDNRTKMAAVKKRILMRCTYRICNDNRWNWSVKMTINWNPRIAYVPGITTRVSSKISLIFRATSDYVPCPLSL